MPVLHPVVQALQDRFVLGMLLGDADLCASVYAATACILPPDGEMRCGRPEIREFWQQVIDSGGRGDRLRTEHVDVYGHRIVERGVYARFDQPVALECPRARGSYAVVIERQACGNWAWAADVWTQIGGGGEESNLPDRGPRSQRF